MELSWTKVYVQFTLQLFCGFLDHPGKNKGHPSKIIYTFFDHSIFAGVCSKRL